MEEKTGKELKCDTYITFIDPSLVDTTENNNIRMEKITIQGKIKWNKKIKRKLRRKLKPIKKIIKLLKRKKNELVTSCNQQKEE